MDEFSLINDYFKRAPPPFHPELQLGIGDDAAVLQPQNNQQLLLSNDSLLVGTHFPKNARPEQIAQRALLTNISDLAAMGAKPKWFTLALTAQHLTAGWLQKFTEGLFQVAVKFEIDLIGGDTCRCNIDGFVSVGIQIIGTCEKEQKPLLRSGAKDGDLVVVTGNLGDAALAVELLEKPIETLTCVERYLLGRYWNPAPRVEFAAQAAATIHAACDISDGLIADLGHICQQSQLHAQVRASDLPLSKAALEYAPESPFEIAATGGDDYELCMAIAPDQFKKTQAIAARLGVKLTTVGHFSADGDSLVNCQNSRVSLLDDNGQNIVLKNKGYQHF